VTRTVRAFVVAMAMGSTSGGGAQTVAPPERHTVLADGHPIAVWSRQPASPREVVLLIHGRTWSSLPDFDLQVPCLQRSVMVSLAARGIAAYAIDLRGYGATPRNPDGWLTPTRAVADVEHVLRWLAHRHSTLRPPAVIGWSRGAAIGMLAVQRATGLTSSLVVFGFAFEPGNPFGETTPAALPARARNTPAAARADFISPSVTSPAVIRAFVDQALRADPVMADLRGDDEFNGLDPSRVDVPVLLLYGDRDPTVTTELATKLHAGFTRTGVSTVVLTGADHAAHLENTHDRWVRAVDDFVSHHRVAP
jgi:alpha-beta hydrolase superfamily lysophospholipase